MDELNTHPSSCPELFTSIQNEIDLDYVGNIDYWLRYNKYDIVWQPTKKYKHPDYNTKSCEFKYLCMDIKRFDDNLLLVPYNEVLTDYPELKYMEYPMGVRKDSNKMRQLQRDIKLKELIELQIV